MLGETLFRQTCAENLAMPITSINPATGKAIRTYDEMTPETAAAAIVRAHSAWLSWRTTSFGERQPLMKKTARYCGTASPSSRR